MLDGLLVWTKRMVNTWRNQPGCPRVSTKGTWCGTWISSRTLVCAACVEVKAWQIKCSKSYVDEGGAEERVKNYFNLEISAESLASLNPIIWSLFLEKRNAARGLRETIWWSPSRFFNSETKRETWDTRPNWTTGRGTQGRPGRMSSYKTFRVRKTSPIQNQLE